MTYVRGDSCYILDEENNIIMAKVQFEKDIALLLEDCDEYEIRIIKDMIGSLKDTLRRDANLRTADRKTL